MSRRALVSGAGIAGASIALWLARLGWETTVVERAPELRPGGQAVDFRGEVHRTVLAQMGVADAVAAHRTGATDWRLVDRRGEIRGVVPGEFLGGDVEIQRGDLARVLAAPTLDRVDYRFDDSVTAVHDGTDGARVEFERGAPGTWDLVVGADGIHSAVRRAVFGPEDAFVQRSGWRYAVAGEHVARADGTPQRMRALLYSEPGRTVIEGGGKAPALFVYRGDAPYDRRSPDSIRTELRRAYAGMGWRTAEVLETALASDALHLDEIARVRMPELGRGHVVLLGDAGYGNTLGGFGTGLAIVGAYVLAGELTASDPSTALPRYEAVMRRMTKGTGGLGAGRFMAPPTRIEIELRHRVWSSARMRRLYVRIAERMADRTPLPDYPALATLAAIPSSTSRSPNSSSSS